MSRMLFIAWKEILELRQNARLLPVIFVAPFIQLFLFGYAATTDVRNVPTIVADGDRSTASRELVARFEQSRFFTIVETVTTADEVVLYLERGWAKLAITIPAGYGTLVQRGVPATVQVIADGTDSNSTTVALGYATALVAGYAQELAARTAPSAAPRGLEPVIRVWFNPQLESRMFMIPGVLALLLLVVTTNLSSMAIVREREIGTLEQLNVTPVRRWELIVGKLLPYALVGMFDALLVLFLTVYWFELPLRGSLFLLVALSLVFLLCTLGLGLFVSTISNTQQQAMMTVVFFFLVPMVYLSGFIFPIENMPAVIQPFTFLIPLRYYLTIVRGIFLKGVGLETLWMPAAALALWAVGVLTLSVARLRKRIA